MSTNPAIRQQPGVRWGLTTSLIFGSVAWVIGMTIPGNMHGTSIQATVLWSLVMGTLAYLPGDIIGKVVAEMRARQVRPR